MENLSEYQRQEVMEELPALRRYCLSLVGQPADADDLLQATVERLLKNGIPTQAPAGKWMFRICKNLWIDELRYREVRERLSSRVVDVTDEPAELEQTAGGQRNVELVLRALDTLPEEQRATMLLVTVEGKSYAEAADILGVPNGTVMSRIARGRKALIQYFKEQRLEEVISA